MAYETDNQKKPHHVTVLRLGPITSPLLAVRAAMSRSLETMPQKKARKAGRPPLPKGRAKNGTLRVRVTPDELRAIEGKAKVTKQTVSEWIRSTLNANL